MRRSKVYIAGFDVFRPDAEIVFASIRMSAAMLGLEALVPTDCDLAVGKDGTHAEVAFKIRESNITLLRPADAVIANLAPFRGLEPDAGTVYEVGFAQALGRPVAGYCKSCASYASRVGAVVECKRYDDGCLREVRSGMAVEDFGLPMNLMLACGLALHESADQALRAVADTLSKRNLRPPSGSVEPCPSRHLQALRQPSLLGQPVV